MSKNSYLTITDQFCGAGGSSQGVRKVALKKNGGIEVKLALNHWKLAIETHNTNFPDTIHDCTDISAADPRRYPSTDGLITSPECTNHSLARGKKQSQKQIDLFNSGKLDPAAERSRATMWDVPRFAEYHKYNFVIVENVVDARRWVMFDSWIHAMHSLGYLHKCVYLNSQHCFPTPQSRDRMYVVFWKRGNKAPNLEINPEAWCQTCDKKVYSIQTFKRGTGNYGKYRQQYFYSCPSCAKQVEPYYYAAFNCIDWSVPGTRIGDRSRPLAPNTISRIEFGRKKYGTAPLCIVGRYTSGIECRVKGMDEIINTQSADPSTAIFNPFLAYLGDGSKPRSYSLNDSFPTQTTQHRMGLVSPVMVYLDHSKESPLTSSGNDPLRTQTTCQNAGFVMPYIIESNRSGKVRGVNETISTILAGGNHDWLIQQPFIVENFGESNARSIMDRLGAITTKSKYGLVSHISVSAFMQYYYNGSTIVNGMADPARTMTTIDRSAIVNIGKAESIEDCTYRMLMPSEVQRAMAFDDDYVVLGNGRDKVKQLGNAVTPPAMEILVERCVDSLQ